MAVVINELEVVVENESDINAKDAPQQPPTPPPVELEDLDERRALYRLRVYAH